MIIVLVIFIVVLVFLIKTYTLKHDTVVAYTGGLGSGKTLNAVKTSLKLLRKNRLKVKFHNFFQRFKKISNRVFWETPLLYSNIAVKIHKGEMAVKLTADHLLLVSRLVPRSIVLIDEIGGFASQFEFDLPNLQDNFNEFTRLYRHYTFGGYLVVTDQCSENIVLYVRRRINTVFNLMRFKRWFWIFFTVRVRNISLSEEIKTIEEEDTEDNTTLLFGLMPLNRYDTYCYSVRYDGVPYSSEDCFEQFKQYDLLRVPKKRFKSLTLKKPPENLPPNSDSQ